VVEALGLLVGQGHYLSRAVGEPFEHCETPACPTQKESKLDTILFGEAIAKDDNFPVSTTLNTREHAVYTDVLKWGAILAVMSLPAAAGELPKPLPVRFQLADGVRVTGTMSAWDADGFDGTFGRRLWVELVADDVWKLYRLVIDPAEAGQWVNLGRVLLQTADGVSWAERAFRRAVDLDSSVAPGIDAARREAAEVARVARERAEAIAAERLKTGTPEADAWPADPWPTLTADEQDAATEVLKTDAGEMLGRAGLLIEPIETPDFLVYGDIERLEAARWAIRLDAVAARLRRLMRLAEDRPIFWGKAVVFIFGDQDRFRLLEVESFGQLVSRQRVGICHLEGPKVFMNFFRAEDQELFFTNLVHELVHGFMHRYHTPRRLPAWANEGLAEYVAAAVVGERSLESTIHEARRRQGLSFIRSGAPVEAVLDLAYNGDPAGTWPGPGGIGEAVSPLLIELMIGQQPQRFVGWVQAVKAGKEWEVALAEEFGVPRARLLDTFVRYYKVND